jgi:hypothetical protein
MTSEKFKFGLGGETLELTSDFKTKEELLRKIATSCLVPYWSGKKPIKLRHGFYVSHF